MSPGHITLHWGSDGTISTLYGQFTIAGKGSGLGSVPVDADMVPFAQSKRMKSKKRLWRNSELLLLQYPLAQDIIHK